MLYCISDAKFPMSYVSSGNLVSEGRFVHPRRILDTFVFILVQQGTLHITQGQKNYSVHSNELLSCSRTGYITATGPAKESCPITGFILM